MALVPSSYVMLRMEVERSFKGLPETRPARETFWDSLAEIMVRVSFVLIAPLDTLLLFALWVLVALAFELFLMDACEM